MKTKPYYFFAIVFIVIRGSMSLDFNVEMTNTTPQPKPTTAQQPKLTTDKNSSQPKNSDQFFSSADTGESVKSVREKFDSDEIMEEEKVEELLHRNSSDNCALIIKPSLITLTDEIINRRLMELEEKILSSLNQTMKKNKSKNKKTTFLASTTKRTRTTSTSITTRTRATTTTTEMNPIEVFAKSFNDIDDDEHHPFFSEKDDKAIR